jgi:hypothetical protein
LAKPLPYESTVYAQVLEGFVVKAGCLVCSGEKLVLRDSQRMFIKLTRSKSRTYAQLVESFCDGQGQRSPAHSGHFGLRR